MNEAKIEYILIDIQQQLAKYTNTRINNLAVYVVCLDWVHTLISTCRIKTKCRAAYAQLYDIGKIRKYLVQQNAEQLIHAPEHSRIEYCNGLLTGVAKYIIRKLQMVQDTATRVLCRVGKYQCVYCHLTSNIN